MEHFSTIDQLFTALPENDDTEFVRFTLSDYEMRISREETGRRTDNQGNVHPPFKGFSVDLSIEEALRIRDFLNFSLPE